jgi:hypothetical protein
MLDGATASGAIADARQVRAAKNGSGAGAAPLPAGGKKGVSPVLVDCPRRMSPFWDSPYYLDVRWF